MGRAQPAAALTQIGQLPRKSAQRGALSAFPMAPEPKPGVVGAVLAEFLLLLGASAVFAWRRGRRTGVAAFLPPPVVDVAGTRWCKGDGTASADRRRSLPNGARRPPGLSAQAVTAPRSLLAPRRRRARLRIAPLTAPRRAAGR